MTETRHIQQIVEDGSLKSTRARSVARLYPTGVSLVTSGRPSLASVSIQNLETSKEVKFWHGLIPEEPLTPETSAYLPEDPSGWSTTQINKAIATISTYGETVKGGQYLEPFLTPTQQIYSYVASGTVRAHVKEG